MLKQLRKFMLPPMFVGSAGIESLDLSQQSNCNTAGDWCQAVSGYGLPLNDGTCAPSSGTNTYFSSIRTATNYVLYIHHSLPRSGTAGGYQAIPCGNGNATGYRNPNIKVTLAQSGCWRETWLNPQTGATLTNTLRDIAANQQVGLANAPPRGPQEPFR